MIRGLLASIRFRLLLLVFLAVIPALGFALYAHLEHRQMTAIHAEQELLRLARVISSDHQRSIEGVHQLLVALTRLPAVQQRDAPPCSSFFATLLKQYPIYANLGVIEPGGNIFCSALPMSRPINAADRTFFQRVMETRAFAIGDYQIGRITGEAAINVGAPVLGETGQVQAVVFAALRLSWINQVMTKVQLPERSRLVVIDRNGVILAHYPDSERWVGQSTSGIPVAKIVLARGEGVVKAPDREGMTRLYGFTSLHGTPNGPDMYAWIGVPESVVYAEVHRLLILSLTGLGIVGGLAIAVAWVFSDLFILRRVRVLVEGTERLKAGDLESRVQVTGRDELAAMAISFNGMADQIQVAYGQLAAQVKELTRREREISLLREIDQKLLADMPLADLLSRAVEAFTQLAEAESCVMVTEDTESGGLKPVAICTPDPEGARRYFADMRLRVGEGALGRAIATRETVLSPDIANDPYMERYRDALLALGIRAILAVPVRTDQQVLGAVGIGYSTVQTFSEAGVQTMKGFANQLAVVWEQARLREEGRERWRLEEAARLKALFIANMSHELRTPLNSILGFSTLLQDETFGTLNDKQRRYVGHIREGGTHLLALIDDILDLSKVEAGKIELRIEPLLLPDALESAVDLLRGQVVKQGIALELQIGEGLPQILADPVRIRQILFNLLSNAIKFTTEGGRIAVAAKLMRDADSTEWVEIAITDTGIGIKPNDLPRLFQPFVRLETALGAHAKGTGLGLALTKHLVELHGGQIFAASEGEGRGSTFTVRLPVGQRGEGEDGAVA